MYALNRIATTSGIPFIPYSFWTVVLSAIVLFVASVIARVPPRLSGQHVQSYATIGLLNMALPLSVLTFVAPKVPAAILSLGQPLLPMITYALALGVAIERLRLMRLGGLVLGLVGVLLIVAPDSSMPEPDMAGWVLIALTAQLSIAVGAIAATKYAPPNASSLTMAAGVQTCAALFLLPAMAVDGSWWAFDSGIGNGELALRARRPPSSSSSGSASLRSSGAPDRYSSRRSTTSRRSPASSGASSSLAMCSARGCGRRSP